MSPVVVTESILTCPSCGTQTRETMPTTTCRIIWECENCGAILRAKSGDCCVFCSYGSVPCPSIQELRSQSEAHREG